jgi:hypothetical protein
VRNRTFRVGAGGQCGEASFLLSTLQHDTTGINIANIMSSQRQLVVYSHVVDNARMHKRKVDYMKGVPQTAFYHLG